MQKLALALPRDMQIKRVTGHRCLVVNGCKDHLLAAKNGANKIGTPAPLEM
jgi:hypothetical protein